MRPYLIALSLLAPSAQPQPQPADYPICITVHPGPIQRPDNYNTHPHGRRSDTA